MSNDIDVHNTLGSLDHYMDKINIPITLYDQPLWQGTLFIAVDWCLV